MRDRLARLSVARQVLVLQVTLVTVLIGAGSVAVLLWARHTGEQKAREEVLAMAETLARAPGTADALRRADPDIDLRPVADLQPVAEAIRHDTSVDFIVLMSPQGVRYTHPNASLIGQHFIGTIAPAAHGQPLTETYTGTLGPSVRAVVPVFDENGQVVGLVAVGITTERLSSVLHRQLPVVVGIALCALALACVGSVAVSRRLRRQTLGLGPVEITRLYEHHDAVLHAIREGLLVTDHDRRLLLANDEAVRLLGLPPDAERRHVSDLGLVGTLAAVLADGREVHDEIHLAGERVLAVNQTPAYRDGVRLGTVATLRDRTELQGLLGELDSVRGFAEALRASAHEAANRLHTVVTLIELGRGEEAVRFATAELAASQELADRLFASVGEPVLAALLFGKVAQAHERGVELVVTGDPLGGAAGEPAGAADLPFEARDLVTVVGNLVDNAIDAALAADPPRRVTVAISVQEATVVVRVADSGTGIAPEHRDDVLTPGWSTKAPGRGLGLALVGQVVARHGGTIDLGDGGPGAVVTVRLPLPSPPTHPAERPVESPARPATVPRR